MYGGFSGSARLSDTWTWDGATWRSISSSLGPREAAALVFDEASGTPLLFGGSDGNRENRETWRYTAAGWQQLSPSVSPPERHGQAMTWDATRNVVVMAMGQRIGVSLGDTWEWTGANWTQINVSAPSPRWGATLVYDPVRQHSVLFGGRTPTELSDTWLYGNRTTPAYVERFGVSCGTASIPRLDIATSAGVAQDPFLGATFGVTLSGLPANAISGIDLGFSRTSFAGLPLPLDLAQWQMPGCFLYQDRVVTYGLATNASGVASFSLLVPNNRFLIGSTLYQQGFAQDASGTPLGIILSNALGATIGAR